MIKNIIIISVILITTMTGCAILDKITEPNTVTPVSQGISAVGTIATTAGQPWGWILTTLGGGLGTLAAIYRNWRNKTKAADKYEAIEVTTESIVKAIESVSNMPATDGKTIGDIVKAEVKTKLEGQKWYEIGKAIITGLKKP